MIPTQYSTIDFRLILYVLHPIIGKNTFLRFVSDSTKMGIFRDIPKF